MPTLLNLPTEVTAAFSLHILKVWGAENGGVIQILTVHTTSQAKAAQFFRSYSPDWTPWLKVATAEPPTMYPIPILSGVNTSSPYYFCKTQDNIVTIVGHMNTATINGITDIKTLAVLLVGYRPKANFETSASYYGGAGFAMGHIRVSSNGSIVARVGAPQQSVYFNISYVAG